VLIAVSNRNPLRFNVGFLLNQPVGTSREFHFDFPSIRLQPDLDVRELHGTVKASKTSQGIFLQAGFDAIVTAECVRCLAEFDQSLHTDFEELLAFSLRSVSESDLVLPEDANIDLAPLLREYLLVEIPISPLCREDCKGLCTICGEDLNKRVCEHQLLADHE
jgi:uncharacterized protein